MDVSTTIRGFLFEALQGFKFKGITVPVFDELVNPNVALPVIGGAETYVVIQDQQSSPAPVQVACDVRLEADFTIRIVTRWASVGSKKLCEDIGAEIDTLLRTYRGYPLIDVNKLRLATARTITEVGQSGVAFSKVLMYSANVNRAVSVENEYFDYEFDFNF